MTIKVNDDRIYVVLEEFVKTVRGIAMPDNHSERSRIGVVKQCGEKVTKYAPGDKVLLSTYAGVRIHLIDREIDGVPIDEDRHRIIREEEVLCQIID